MSKKSIENYYAQHAASLLQFIRARVNSNTNALNEDEDLLHDTFSALISAFNYTAPLENLGAYVYRSLKNKMIDNFRKKHLDIDEDIDVEHLDVDDVITDFVAQENLKRELTSALAKLPAEQRDVFLKTELEGLSFKEMSAQTGTSVNTLISQKRYAIQKLKVLLEN